MSAFYNYTEVGYLASLHVAAEGAREATEGEAVWYNGKRFENWDSLGWYLHHEGIIDSVITDGMDSHGRPIVKVKYFISK